MTRARRRPRSQGPPDADQPRRTPRRREQVVGAEPGVQAAAAGSGAAPDDGPVHLSSQLLNSSTRCRARVTAQRIIDYRMRTAGSDRSTSSTLCRASARLASRSCGIWSLRERRRSVLHASRPSARPGAANAIRRPRRAGHRGGRASAVSATDARRVAAGALLVLAGLARGAARLDANIAFSPLASAVDTSAAARVVVHRRPPATRGSGCASRRAVERFGDRRLREPALL